MRKHRAATQGMKHFGQPGFHPGSLAGGENDNMKGLAHQVS
jgi:hypothetical protein